MTATRILVGHKVNPANDTLSISVTDERGSGGANHRYEISGFAPSLNPSAVAPDDASDRLAILFQNGPINEVGVNGVTQEVLLEVLVDRLRSFQAGPFACRENALALTKLEEAQHWLHHRTKRRVDQGVEGTHQPDKAA